MCDMKNMSHLLANFVLLSAKEFSVNDHDLKNKGIDVKFDIDLLIWIECNFSVRNGALLELAILYLLQAYFYTETLQHWEKCG